MDEPGRTSPAQWLELATLRVAFGPDRAAVRKELEEHIEDKALDLQRIFPDMTWEEAQERAVSDMGDPAEIGAELARIHRPWLGYLWRVSQALAFLAFLCLFLNLCLYGEDAFLGDDPLSELWDFDGLPAYYIDPFYRRMPVEELYLPGENPDQLQVLEDRPKASIAGQTVEVRRAALWREGTRQTLYCYLRLETWKCWVRGALDPERLTVEDSLGTQYPLTSLLGDQPAPEGPAYQFDEWAGYGPFHFGCQLRIQEVDPAAEWIELNYHAPEKGFTLVLELDREVE